MKRNDFAYAAKVWLTGVLVPAVFWGLGGFELFIIASLFSAAFSLPSALLFWGCVRLVNDQAWEVTIKKSVLCVVGVALTGLAFAVMNFDSGGNPLTAFSAWGDFPSIQLGYAAAICLGIVYFDLNSPASMLLDTRTDSPEITPPTPHLHDTND
jgi:hypothetical protein